MVTAFKKNENVSDVKVDFNSKTATVVFDPSKTDEEKVLASLEGSRFKATKKEAPPEKEKGDEPTE